MNGYRFDIWSLDIYEQLSVFQSMIPEASLTHRFRNSLRKDKHGDCNLKWSSGKLKLMDQGGGKEYHTVNMVQLWMNVHNVDFKEAVSGIRNAYSNLFDRKENKENLQKEEEIETIEFHPGFYTERNWSEEDDIYFGQYYLNKEDLKFENCRLLPAKEVRIYSTRLDGYLSYFHSKRNPLYVYDWGDGVIKGYRPGQRPKFVASVKHDYYIIEGDDTVFIGSGGKDIAVVHKYTGWTCIANQGENNLFTLPDKYKGKKIIVSFDGDETGLEQTVILSHKLIEQGEDITYFLCPVQDEIKDYADWVKKLGPIQFKAFLTELNERKYKYTKVHNGFIQISHR